MAKRIAAKIDEYQKDNQTKGKWVDVGVILSNQNGEYIMLNPTVDLSGVLMKQRLLAQKKGAKTGDNVMCSIFDNEPQAPQQGNFQQPVQQPAESFDDEIPF